MDARHDRSAARQNSRFAAIEGNALFLMKRISASGTRNSLRSGHKANEMAVASIQSDGTIVALGGRRIDAEPTLTPRFPFDQVGRVGMEISDRLRRSYAVVLVCSAACGADLIALDAAQKMRLRTRIVLPFSAVRFRETSVVDRPRPEFWGSMFDRVIDVARAHGDLVELNADGSDDAYSTANAVIIEEARKLAGANAEGRASRPLPVIALVVWDGASRRADDNTKKFVKLAQESGFRIEQIITNGAATGRAQ